MVKICEWALLIETRARGGRLVPILRLSYFLMPGSNAPQGMMDLPGHLPAFMQSHLRGSPPNNPVVETEGKNICTEQTNPKERLTPLSLWVKS